MIECCGVPDWPGPLFHRSEPRRRRVVVEHEVDDVFVVKEGLDPTDKIVLEGVRQVRDGEKVEYEFRKPDEVPANPKNPVEK